MKAQEFVEKLKQELDSMEVEINCQECGQEIDTESAYCEGCYNEKAPDCAQCASTMDAKEPAYCASCVDAKDQTILDQQLRIMALAEKVDGIQKDIALKDLQITQLKKQVDILTADLQDMQDLM